MRETVSSGTILSGIVLSVTVLSGTVLSGTLLSVSVLYWTALSGTVFFRTHFDTIRSNTNFSLHLKDT